MRVFRHLPFGHRQEVAETAPRDPHATVLEAVDSALKLSAPFLATNPNCLPVQLTGRLAGSPELGIAHLLGAVRERAPRPTYLRSTRSFAITRGRAR